MQKCLYMHSVTLYTENGLPAIVLILVCAIVIIRKQRFFATKYIHNQITGKGQLKYMYVRIIN